MLERFLSIRKRIENSIVQLMVIGKSKWRGTKGDAMFVSGILFSVVFFFIFIFFSCSICGILKFPLLILISFVCVAVKLDFSFAWKIGLHHFMLLTVDSSTVIQ